MEPDRGHHRRHLGNVEFLAQVVDQFDEVLLILFLGRAAVFVSLKPAEAGDLIALAFVAGHDLFQLAEGLADAFDHQSVFEPFPCFRARPIGLAARRWTEIKPQRAISHGRLDQQHLLVVKVTHDAAEAQFGADAAPVV